MENGIINVANRLPRDRYKVSLCALDSSETFSERFEAKDAEFYLVPPKRAGIDWSLIPRLAKVFRRSGADVIHSHNWGTFLYAVLAAKRARVPIIHGEHGKNPGELEGEGRFKRLAKSVLGKRVDRVVTVSREIATEWAAYGIPSSKIVNIPNGVDESRFRPRTDGREQRRRYGLPEKAFIVGSIGRLDELKNYDVLIEALAMMAGDHPDVCVALLGDGPRMEHLRAMAARLGVQDRTYFLGRHPDPENFLAALDVFALPSKTEGMSNVVLEAMASGLPLICANLPCHGEVFEAGKEGVTVDPCDPAGWAAEIGRLQHSVEILSALAESARRKVLQRFGLVRMVNDYGNEYASAFGFPSVQ